MASIEKTPDRYGEDTSKSAKLKQMLSEFSQSPSRSSQFDPSFKISDMCSGSPISLSNCVNSQQLPNQDWNSAPWNTQEYSSPISNSKQKDRFSPLICNRDLKNQADHPSYYETSKGNPLCLKTKVQNNKNSSPKSCYSTREEQIELSQSPKKHYYQQNQQSSCQSRSQPPPQKEVYSRLFQVSKSPQRYQGSVRGSKDKLFKENNQMKDSQQLTDLYQDQITQNIEDSLCSIQPFRNTFQNPQYQAQKEGYSPRQQNSKNGKREPLVMINPLQIYKVFKNINNDNQDQQQQQQQYLFQNQQKHQSSKSNSNEIKIIENNQVVVNYQNNNQTTYYNSNNNNNSYHGGDTNREDEMSPRFFGEEVSEAEKNEEIEKPLNQNTVKNNLINQQGQNNKNSNSKQCKNNKQLEKQILLNQQQQQLVYNQYEWEQKLQELQLLQKQFQQANMTIFQNKQAQSNPSSQVEEKLNKVERVQRNLQVQQDLLGEYKSLLQNQLDPMNSQSKNSNNNNNSNINNNSTNNTNKQIYKSTTQGEIAESVGIFQSQSSKYPHPQQQQLNLNLINYSSLSAQSPNETSIQIYPRSIQQQQLQQLKQQKQQQQLIKQIIPPKSLAISASSLTSPIKPKFSIPGIKIKQKLCQQQEEIFNEYSPRPNEKSFFQLQSSPTSSITDNSQSFSQYSDLNSFRSQNYASINISNHNQKLQQMQQVREQLKQHKDSSRQNIKFDVKCVVNQQKKKSKSPCASQLHSAREQFFNKCKFNDSESNSNNLSLPLKNIYKIQIPPSQQSLCNYPSSPPKNTAGKDASSFPQQPHGSPKSYRSNASPKSQVYTSSSPKFVQDNSSSKSLNGSSKKLQTNESSKQLIRDCSAKQLFPQGSPKQYKQHSPPKSFTSENIINKKETLNRSPLHQQKSNGSPKSLMTGNVYLKQAKNVSHKQQQQKQNGSPKHFIHENISHKQNGSPKSIQNENINILKFYNNAVSQNSQIMIVQNQEFEGRLQGDSRSTVSTSSSNSLRLFAEENLKRHLSSRKDLDFNKVMENPSRNDTFKNSLIGKGSPQKKVQFSINDDVEQIYCDRQMIKNAQRSQSPRPSIADNKMWKF